MEKRKTIACIMMRPEEIYQKRVMEGLQAQCEAYGYNLAVFSPLVGMFHYFKDYLTGEMNIFNLPDFSRFDAVIMVTIPLVLGNDSSFPENYVKKIREQTDIPIISLDFELEYSDCIHTDDIAAFYNITKHVINEHKCKKIYMFTGHKHNEISERRIKGFSDAMNDSGLSFTEDNIFYGDFWYTSGKTLAERIISGEIPLPEAVVCASDHMAIGLANELEQAGIKIPEQVVITGYEATIESIANEISVTSYIPDVSVIAAEAINKIRKIIEPDKPLIKACLKNNTGIFLGESCGCDVNPRTLKRHLQPALYCTNRNYGDSSLSSIDDISNLMENYMLENLTNADTPFKCIELIFSYLYHIVPYNYFYMCLSPDWLNTDNKPVEGYPEKMRCVIKSEYKNGHTWEKPSYISLDEKYDFDTKLMLPDLWIEREKPAVFYFAPCHFSDNTLGYSVFCSDLENRSQLTVVFHNWLRNVNNALEMIRTRNKLLDSAIYDSMTKLYNRAGMNIRFGDMLIAREDEDKILAVVIDMDGLKTINDNYGHNEGDFALMTIASVVRFITSSGEAAVRAGGDEFYILGAGNYTEKDIDERIAMFYSKLDEINKNTFKPYEITASIGYAIMPVSEVTDLSKIIAVADEEMYNSKIKRKKNKKK